MKGRSYIMYKRVVWILMEGNFSLECTSCMVQTVRMSNWEEDDTTKSFGTRE